MKFYLSQTSDDFQVIRYPAGELQVRLMGDAVRRLQSHANGPYEVDLIARITNAEDIIILSLLKDAICGVDPRLRVHAWLPYLPYARADRRFTEGDCNGISAFAGLINAMGFDSVISWDCHSEASALSIPGLQVQRVDKFIEKSIVDFSKKTKSHKLTVLFPDEGATHRYTIRDNYGCNIYNLEIRVLYATKHRDPSTGVFKGFAVPSVGTDPVLIVDDICDGGGTFVGIAEQIPAEVPLGLYVTHGIFSKGMDVLHRFSQIYCTDTFRASYNTPGPTVFEIGV